LTTNLSCTFSYFPQLWDALTDVHRRFLRARRFSPPEAFKQFKETEDWRREHGIVDLFHTIDVEEFEQTRRLVRTPLHDMLVRRLTDRAVPSMARPS
jgi:hypothetical protein